MTIPRFQFVDGVSKAPTGVEADDSASFEERSKKSQQELCRAAQGGEVESMINYCAEYAQWVGMTAI